MTPYSTTVLKTHSSTLNLISSPIVSELDSRCFFVCLVVFNNLALISSVIMFSGVLALTLLSYLFQLDFLLSLTLWSSNVLTASVLCLGLMPRF